MEVAVSTVVIALILMVALQTVASSRMHLRSIAEQNTGQALAHELMSEICNKPYNDPDGNATFGKENDENGFVRTQFDDIDDYNALMESVNADASIAAADDNDVWVRKVTVSLASTAAADLRANNDEGIKRISITVLRNQRQVAQLEALRSSGGDELAKQLTAEQ